MKKITKRLNIKFKISLAKRKESSMKLILGKKINRPKELWKTLNSMGLPSKAVTASNICSKDKNETVINATKNCSIFKNYFSSLPQNLVSKPPLLRNIFTVSTISSYDDNNTVSEDLNFQLLETSPEKILSILKDLSPSKAAGIDNLSGKFLKDDAHVLVRPISPLCNLPVKLNSFSRSYKIAKVKPLLKKCSKTDHQNYRPISLVRMLSKIIERIVHDETEGF